MVYRGFVISAAFAFKHKTASEVRWCLVSIRVGLRSTVPPGVSSMLIYDQPPPQVPLKCPPLALPLPADRKSVVQGKSVDLGGRRIIKKKNMPLSETAPPLPKSENCYARHKHLAVHVR